MMAWCNVCGAYAGADEVGGSCRECKRGRFVDDRRAPRWDRDRYLRLCRWAQRRYASGDGRLVISRGGVPSAYSRVEEAAARRYLGFSGGPTIRRSMLWGPAPRHRCGGVMRDGPEKRYARCGTCGRIDYERYEGDRCPAPRWPGFGEDWR